MVGDQHGSQSASGQLLKMAFMLPAVPDVRRLPRRNEGPELSHDLAFDVFEPGLFLQRPQRDLRSGRKLVPTGDQYEKVLFEQPSIIDPVGGRRRATRDGGIHFPIQKHFRKSVGRMLDHVDP